MHSLKTANIIIYGPTRSFVCSEETRTVSDENISFCKIWVHRETGINYVKIIKLISLYNCHYSDCTQCLL